VPAVRRDVDAGDRVTDQVRVGRGDRPPDRPDAVGDVRQLEPAERRAGLEVGGDQHQRPRPVLVARLDDRVEAARAVVDPARQAVALDLDPRQHPPVGGVEHPPRRARLDPSRPALDRLRDDQPAAVAAQVGRPDRLVEREARPLGAARQVDHDRGGADRIERALPVEGDQRRAVAREHPDRRAARHAHRDRRRVGAVGQRRRVEQGQRRRRVGERRAGGVDGRAGRLRTDPAGGRE